MLTWKLTKAMHNKHLLEPVNRLRTGKGLAPVYDFLAQAWSSQLLNLIAVSPPICQKADDWGDQYRICGYFGSVAKTNSWQMPKDLEQFINKSEKVIFMTLGSMAPKEQGKQFTSAMRFFQCHS